MEELKSQIAVLKQLQELVLTRDEHHQTGDGSRLDELNESIANLQKKLAPQIAGLYDRLYKRNHVVLAAMSNGCCAGCGLQVPIAQIQQVRLGKHLVTCSNCGRMLFDAGAGAAVNIAERGDRDDVKTGIARFSTEGLMIANLEGNTPEAVITELAKLMASEKLIANPDSLITAALEREAVLSTAIDCDAAFPHVRGVEGGSLTMAIGVSKAGIDWFGDKVHLVFFSAIPVAVSAFYLRLMAGIAQAITKAEIRKTMIGAADAKALWKAVVKATRATIK